MIVLGIDENGLGPVLGSMVVTATAFRVSDYDPGAFWKTRHCGLEANDSKIVFTKPRAAHAERITRAWLDAFGSLPQNASQLREWICLPCPHLCTGFAPACRPDTPLSLPHWDTAPSPTHRTGRAFNRPLTINRITLLAVRAISICVGRFNREMSHPGANKLQFDFSQMMTLIAHFRTAYPNDAVLALCGKVGGTRAYGRWLDQCGFTGSFVLKESPHESHYRVPHHNLQLRFIKDGDALHMPIAVASMVGKYIREVEMMELNTQLQQVPPVSGYRDARTRRCIDETAHRRRAIGLPDDCFIRHR